MCGYIAKGPTKMGHSAKFVFPMGTTWNVEILPLNLCLWGPIEMGKCCQGPNMEGDSLLNLCSWWGPLEMGINCQRPNMAGDKLPNLCSRWGPINGDKWQRSKIECDKLQKFNNSKYLQQKRSDTHCEDDKHCVSDVGKH
jgi:hypothetical protein